MTVQYARHYGGIVIQFNDNVHENLLRTLQTAIEKNEPAGRATNIKEEDQYLAESIRMTAMIPLTFIQFAKYFYPIGKHSDSTSWFVVPVFIIDVATKFFESRGLDATTVTFNAREAFIRASLNGAKILIEEMLEHNLKLALDTQDYNAFYSDMMDTTKKIGIRAIFYDEVHRLSTRNRGHFIHAPGSSYSDTQRVRNSHSIHKFTHSLRTVEAFDI